MTIFFKGKFFPDINNGLTGYGADCIHNRKAGSYGYIYIFDYRNGTVSFCNYINVKFYDWGSWG